MLVWASASWPPATPARGLVLPDVAEVLDRVPHQIDPATLPTITVAQDVADWDHQVAGPEMQGIVLTLAENLELESQALLRQDAAILAAVDHGDRLAEMQERLQRGQGDRDHRRRPLPVRLAGRALLVPFGRADRSELGFDRPRHADEETYDAGRRPCSRSTLALRPDVRDAAGDRRALAQRGRAAIAIRRLGGIRG